MLIPEDELLQVRSAVVDFEFLICVGVSLLMEVPRFRATVYAYPSWVPCSLFMDATSVLNLSPERAADSMSSQKHSLPGKSLAESRKILCLNPKPLNP